VLDQAKYLHIKFERRDHGVVLATLNRPERLNATNRQMHWEITELPRDAALDLDLKVLVITGAGRAFCAGGDFGPPDPEEKPGGAPELPADDWGEGIQVVENLLDFPKPVISAVNGPAMGLGANYALLCDIVVASNKAVFGDPHVKIGVGAGDGGQVIWPLLMGPNRAKYYLMTGDKLDAAEADRLGLVNFVVEGDPVPRALEIAERLAKGPALAISASKVPINRRLKSIAQQIMPLSLEMEMANFKSEDHAEAVKAFQEKREPVFKSR